MLIAGIGIWTATSRVSDAPYTILVDDKPIVSLESREAAKTVLRKARLQGASGVPAGSIRFAQRVTLRQAPKEVEIADVPEAVRALENAVTVEAELFTITASNTQVAAFTEKQDAEETLHLLKRHYDREIRNLYTETTFKERVSIEQRHVELDKLYSSPEEAVRGLTAIVQEPMIHTLQRGDRAVNLARQYGVSLSDLERLNPDVDLERIVEGDRLLIRRAKPPVTVISKALISKTVTIPRPPEARRQKNPKIGKRRIQLLVTYENGEPVGEKIISQVTTWESPKPTRDKPSDKSSTDER